MNYSAAQWAYIAAVLIPMLVVFGVFAWEIVRHVRGKCDGC